MILELVLERCSQDAEARGSSVRGSSLADPQVSKILVQHCAAPLPLTGYYSRELSSKFPDLKCNCAADGMCTQSMDLVGDEF